MRLLPRRALARSLGWRVTTFHVEVDHVVPRTSGGDSSLDNLRLLHSSCNWLKDAFPIRRRSCDRIVPAMRRSADLRVLYGSRELRKAERALELHKRRYHSHVRPKKCSCGVDGCSMRRHRPNYVTFLPGSTPDWYPETDGQMAEWFAESEGGL